MGSGGRSAHMSKRRSERARAVDARLRTEAERMLEADERCQRAPWHAVQGYERRRP